MVTLQGKQKLVYDAVKKIEEGERLIREGQIELNNLIPTGKLEVLGVSPPYKKISIKATRQRIAVHVIRRLFLKAVEENNSGIAPTTWSKSNNIGRPKMNQVIDQLLKEGAIRVVTAKSGRRKVFKQITEQK